MPSFRRRLALKPFRLRVFADLFAGCRFVCGMDYLVARAILASKGRPDALVTFAYPALSEL
jgi:hypothetical protein